MTREEELGIIIDGIENLDIVAMVTARMKWNSSIDSWTAPFLKGLTML